jgi:glutamine cyclotransferase
MFGKDATVVNLQMGSRRNYRPLWSQKNGQNTTAEVLNGIAYNPKNWNYFVTGKNWDKIFEITVSE